MNTKRTFDEIQQSELGKYVYALIDPRDSKIFYVGQGTSNRVFDHFNDADKLNPQKIDLRKASKKLLRILDIWENDLDVDWIIIAYGLDKSVEDLDLASRLESGVYHCLEQSINGHLLNDNTPPKSSLLLPEDVEALGAEYVNPEEEIHNVFIFPIHAALIAGASPYDATRRAWLISKEFQNLGTSYAVGLKNSISKGSYKVNKWIDSELSPGRFEFLAPGHPNPPTLDSLLNKNWTNVLSVVKGYWQRGNYVIVDFDGRGHFRIKRGSVVKTIWYDCLPPK